MLLFVIYIKIMIMFHASLDFFIFLFRIIVGAPKGTFPGGLDLTDRGQPAINRTGLVYACSITPQTMCDAVLGDENLFQNGDQIDNDGLHGAGRLFDHRRMSNCYCREVSLCTYRSSNVPLS